ncbi:MAG: DNA recombination protein RmuC [Ilumatobacteraceae bacterium]
MKGELQPELGRLGQIVTGLGERSAEQFGQVDQSLPSPRSCSTSPPPPRVEQAPPTPRPVASGASGGRGRAPPGRVHRERQLRQQTAVEATAGMPTSRSSCRSSTLYMDVKFPLTSYLFKFLDAGTEAERQAHRDQFLRDVRLAGAELASAQYAAPSAAATVDQVLLFLPNETLTSFILEQDPTIVDEAMRQGTLCLRRSPCSALLGLIRRAFDASMIEQTSDQDPGPARQVRRTVASTTRSRRQKRFDSVQRVRQPDRHPQACARTALRELESIRRVKRVCPSTASRSSLPSPAPATGTTHANWAPDTRRADCRSASQPLLDFGDDLDVDDEGSLTYTVGELADASTVTSRALAGGWVRQIQGWNERGPHGTSAGRDGEQAGGAERSSSPRPDAGPPILAAIGCALDGLKGASSATPDFFAGSARLAEDEWDRPASHARRPGDAAAKAGTAPAGRSGMYDANWRRLLAAPLRIGVITSVDSAAWADFSHEIERSGARIPAAVRDVRAQANGRSAWSPISCRRSAVTDDLDAAGAHPRRWAQASSPPSTPRRSPWRSPRRRCRCSPGSPRDRPQRRRRGGTHR